MSEGVFLQLKFFLILSIAIMSFMKCVQTHRYMYIYWIHPALKLIGSRHTNAFKHITFYMCAQYLFIPDMVLKLSVLWDSCR